MNTKEKILKNALDLFAKQGIDKTSTAQITQKAGIAEGTLFVHFKTKQELIDALYIRIKRNVMRNLNDCVNSKFSVEENIKAISKKAIEYLLKNYSELVFMELMDNDPKISQAAVKIVQKEYLNISKLLKEWQKQGYLKNVKLELLQETTWHIIIAITKYCRAKRVKKINESSLNLVWDAVRK